MFALFSERKTVSGVLSAFHKAINELDEVTTSNQAEAERQAENAREALAAQQAAEQEVALAKDVKGRLEALVGAAGLPAPQLAL